VTPRPQSDGAKLAYALIFFIAAIVINDITQPDPCERVCCKKESK